MMAWAYSGGKAPPPPLYQKYLTVKELGLTWDDLGGITPEEIGLLGELVGIANQARALQQRVQGARR